MRKVGDKKGQDLTLGTIILIVLGLVVLIFLIYGFSTGWSNLWSKIGLYGGGKVNVDDIRQACEIACVGNQVDTYCKSEKTLYTSDSAGYTGSCQALDDVGAISLSCPEIDCGDVDAAVAFPEAEEEVTKCVGGVGDGWLDSCPEGQIDVTSQVTYQTEIDANNGKVCCKA